MYVCLCMYINVYICMCGRARAHTDKHTILLPNKKPSRRPLNINVKVRRSYLNLDSIDDQNKMNSSNLCNVQQQLFTNGGGGGDEILCNFY